MAEGPKIRKVLGTLHYVLFTDHKFGHGAMGEVVLARHRKKGTAFAAKIYSSKARNTFQKYIQREIDMLQLCGLHDHIVKLIAVEKEKLTGSDVLIMELCEGGSLQDILNKPENYFGLAEEEFLLVFKHIFLALQHIFKKGLIHRDIKPGNIILHITEDERHVYKLTDFGISNVIREARTLCGTQEYLHPAMHGAAVGSSEQIGFCIDLWGFAVTLFQCATGMLPYRPRKGIRENRKIMGKLMTEKEAGVISQIEKDDGSFHSVKELPNTTKLLHGTRQLITEVLARLMDCKNIWNPSDFFLETEKQFSKKKLHLFSADLADTFAVYIDESKGVQGLKEETVAVLSKVGEWNGSVSELVLLVADHYTIKQSENIKDYTAAMNCGGSIYCLLSSSDGICNRSALGTKVTDLFTSEDFSGTSEPKAVFAKILYSEFMIRRLWEIQCFVTEFCNIFVSQIKEKFSKNEMLWKQSLHLKSTVLTIFKDVTDVDADILRKYRHLSQTISGYQSYDDLRKCELQRCIGKTQYNIRQARMIYEFMMVDDNMQEDNHNKEQLHTYYRKQMTDIMNKQKDLLDHQCNNFTINVQNSLRKNIRDMFFDMQRLEKLEVELHVLFNFYNTNISQHLKTLKDMKIN